MAEIIVIAAVAKNNVIGNEGDIPWRIKEDFQHFRKLTMGSPCIMGDKTYESLPENSRPLPGRENIVLSFNKEYKARGAKIMHSFDDAIIYCKNRKKIFITGGASVYRLGLKIADRLELTRIDKDFEGDTFFPEINLEEWELMNKEAKYDDNHGKFSFLSYKRRNK